MEKVIQIGATICDALAYLHNHQPPIIHRDIKPGNIKITSSGQIILVDFGLAKMDVEGQATATGAQSLTPGYAPPEQYGKGTDARSDIYGLGATLYAILTNNIPEDGIARLVGAVELTPIRKLRPEVPEALANAVEKAISIHREKRFQNIEAFREALTGKPGPISSPTMKITQVQPAPAVTIAPGANLNSAPGTAQKKGGSLKFLWFIVVGLILLGLIELGLNAGVLLLQNSSQSYPKTASTQPIVLRPTIVSNANTQPALIPTHLPTVPDKNGQPESTKTVLVIQPSSVPSPLPVRLDQIAFTSERSGNPQVWVMNADGTSPQKTTSLPGGACQPAWSPDGLKLVFVSPCSGPKDKYSGSGLFTINANGTGLLPLPSVPGGDFDPSWSPDGSQIAFTSIRSGFFNLYLITLADKTITQITSHTNIIERSPAWSPDGTWLAFENTQFNQNQIWIMQKGRWSQAKPYTSQDTSDINPSWSPDGKSLIFSQGTGLPWLATKAFNAPAAPEIRLSDIRPALQPVYSSDGTRVIFVSRVNGKSDIYALALSDGKTQKLTDDSSADYDPAWRPVKP